MTRPYSIPMHDRPMATNAPDAEAWTHYYDRVVDPATGEIVPGVTVAPGEVTITVKVEP